MCWPDHACQRTVHRKVVILPVPSAMTMTHSRPLKVTHLFPSRRRALVALRGVGILRLSTDAVLFRAFLGADPHVVVIVDVPQAVVDDAVQDAAVTEPEARPRLWEVVRRVRHALEAAGRHGPPMTERDALSGEHHRLHARGTHLNNMC